MKRISLDDEIAIINFAIENENIRGALNAVSPNPVTNRNPQKHWGDGTYCLTILPLLNLRVPDDIGEMGDVLLLASTKVIPKRLRCWIRVQISCILKPAIEHAVCLMSDPTSSNNELERVDFDRPIDNPRSRCGSMDRALTPMC